jgi:hypothetical protein
VERQGIWSKEAGMSKLNQPPKFHILIDTCVWLDVAKDYQQQAILAALEELIRHGDVASFCRAR